MSNTKESYSDTKLEGNEVTVEFVIDMMEMFKEGKGEVPPETDVTSILEKALNIFKRECSLVDIKLLDGEKLTICGDIHGQFFDLMNIFEMNNLPKPTNPYLFNGDIVDRGAFSVECILTLLCFKILYPNKFFIARGNHESGGSNELYGFGKELTNKYPKSFTLMDKFQDVFNWLPLGHLINDKILVVHGGLSRKKELTLDNIRNIRRGRDVPSTGVVADLLWSDPRDESGLGKSPRGSGVLFGPDVTEDFCRRNGIETIVRSHQVQSDGYSTSHNGRIVTVFSAPNYCDLHGNAGAYITLRGGSTKLSFHVFREAVHPDVPPFLDGTTIFQ